MKSLTRNWFLGVAGCLILAAGIALAEKGGNGGGKGGGGGGGSKDIPICVTVNDAIVADEFVFDIISDGGGDYCNSKKDKITAIVGRLAGQVFLQTNANLSLDGSSMVFFFPVLTETDVFGSIGVDIYPAGFVPTNVWVSSAREQVGVGDGYVDLRKMKPADEPASIAIRIQMELDGQNLVDLNYGDVLWAPGDSNSRVLGGALCTVVAGSDIDGDSFSDSWTISGTTAWMNEVINNDFNNRLPIGEVEMSFSFKATKK